MHFVADMYRAFNAILSGQGCDMSDILVQGVMTQKKEETLSGVPLLGDNCFGSHLACEDVLFGFEFLIWSRILNL